MTLSWLQGDLTGEVADSELLDDLKDVDLAVKLRLGVLLQPIVTLRPFLAAKAPFVAKVSHEKAAPVRIRENLSLGYRLFQPSILILLKQ